MISHAPWFFRREFGLVSGSEGDMRPHTTLQEFHGFSTQMFSTYGPMCSLDCSPLSSSHPYPHVTHAFQDFLNRCLPRLVHTPADSSLVRLQVRRHLWLALFYYPGPFTFMYTIPSKNGTSADKTCIQPNDIYNRLTPIQQSTSPFT